MSNYPEHHGRYERTELVKTKFQMTMAEKRRDRFLQKAEQAQQEVLELEQRIEDLQKEGK